MSDYSVNNIYQGGYSSFKQSYGDVFTGYHATAGDLGLTTDPRTANQLKDFSTKLSSGVKQMELALVSPELIDSIPKQQLKEISRMSKLTGVNVSVHGPVMDSAGMTQQGFSETNREAAERKVIEVVERSYEIDPQGNIPVTFHSAEGIPGTEWKQIPWKEKGIKGEARKMIAVDRESGQMIPLKEEERHYPGSNLDKPTIYSPEQNLEIANTSKWDNEITQLFFNKERADEILEQNEMQIKHLLSNEETRENLQKGNFDALTPTQKDTYMKFQTAQNYLDDINKTANSIFSKAYQYGDETQKRELKKLSEQYKEEVKEGKDLTTHSQAMTRLLNNLKSPILAPKIYVPIEEFATDQSSKTYGNAAFQTFKKFGDKSPIISIENPPAGFALSTGEDLKNLVNKSREQFVQNAVQEGIDKGEAREHAEKLIGVTWDVGHINMIRKQGLSEADVVKESEKIAPLVKHVHLSDNFGFEHTELPMGMGNVPIKEIMKKLGKKGFEARKIIEAGQWWQHFQTSPIKESLEGLGSPVYSDGAGPLWNQSVGFEQGYSAGFGQMLPQVNYQTFGAGFSQLPGELGGQVGGGQGGMSGRPME